MSAYQKEYLLAKEDPKKFWQSQAGNIDWFKKPTKI